MKYRITETPQVDSDPKFWIEAWGYEVNTSIWSNKNTECWCDVTKTGYPIIKGYEVEIYSDYLHSFESLKEAKEYLDKIIVYHKKEVKTVFEIET